MSEKLTNVPGVFTMADRFAGGSSKWPGSSCNKKKINKHYFFIYLLLINFYLLY